MLNFASPLPQGEFGIADVIFVASRYSRTEALSAIAPVPLVAIFSSREWLEQGRMTFSTPKPTTCKPQHSMYID